MPPFFRWSLLGPPHHHTPYPILSPESSLLQASKLGLLSKLEKAGLTLKDVEKLLPLGTKGLYAAFAGSSVHCARVA